MSSLDVNLVWSACVPLTGFLASLSVFVLTASSYGSRLAYTGRVLLWAISFALAAEAVRLTARLLTVAPPPVTTQLESALSFGASVFANLIVVGAVVYALVLHEIEMRQAKKISAVAADFSWKPLPASLTGELSSYGREPAHA